MIHLCCSLHFMSCMVPCAYAALARPCMHPIPAGPTSLSMCVRSMLAWPYTHTGSGAAHLTSLLDPSLQGPHSLPQNLPHSSPPRSAQQQGDCEMPDAGSQQPSTLPAAASAPHTASPAGVSLHQAQHAGQAQHAQQGPLIGSDELLCKLAAEMAWGDSRDSFQGSPGLKRGRQAMEQEGLRAATPLDPSPNRPKQHRATGEALQ